MADITLIDDDENIVASVSLALESQGHTVKAYYDGASGLQALEKSPPDLAILDVKMPLMTGLQATREIREQAPDVAVLILSMHDDERYLFEARHLYVQDGEVGRRLLQRLQPGGAVVIRPDGVALALEGEGHGGDDVLVVVDQGDVGHGRDLIRAGAGPHPFSSFG